MTLTKQALAALTVLAASFAASSPAQAASLRHSENLAYTLHQQTIDYARWLRYHVPQCQYGPALTKDAVSIIREVGELQQILLFSDGSNQQLRQMRRLIRHLDRHIDDSLRRIAEYRAQLRHGGHGHHVVPTPRPTFNVKFGRKVRVELGHHNGRHGQGHIDRGHGNGRLRVALRNLEARLQQVDRTLHQLDESLYRAGH